MSNSSLCGLMPLAIWAAEISDFNLFKKVVTSHVELTHSNPFVHAAASIYCQAIAYLLNNSNDPDRHRKSFDKAKEIA